MLVYLDNLIERIWLVGLLVTWAGLLFGGFAFGAADEKRTGRMPRWTRLSSSFVLVIAGWSWYVFTRESAIGGFSLLIALGMTLGFIGDLFMAELMPLPQPVMGGIGSFGLGHIAYIVAFLGLGNQFGLDKSGPRWGALAVWLLIGLVGWYVVVFRGGKPGVLHWAALPYALLLASTAGFATGLALQAPAFALVAVGAALFLLSDLLIAAQLFNNLHFPFIGDVIWLTYGPAQALIVYGSLDSALQLLSGK